MSELRKLETRAPATPGLFLGIEGGGTRTIAILADGHQRELARIEAGPANLQLLTTDQLRQHLSELGHRLSVPGALCIGLAGLRGPADAKRVLVAAAKVW